MIREADPDLFRTGALSNTDLYLFAYLAPDVPTSARQLGLSTGAGRSTIYDSLRRLDAVGLAFRQSGGWCRLDGSVEELWQVQHKLAAEVFGTVGETDRQRERYDQERSEYLAHCRTVRPWDQIYEIGEDEKFAALPEDQQDYASDLAKRALEHFADLGILPPVSFAHMRRVAFRLVITATATPYEDFEEQAAYIAR